MVAGLATLLPDYFSVFGPAMDVDFGTRDADGQAVNQRFQFGNMVLSRWPIVGVAQPAAAAHAHASTAAISSAAPSRR